MAYLLNQKRTIKRQPWTLFLQARSKNSLGTKIHRTTSLIKKNYNNFEATRRFWASTFQPFAQPKRTKPTQPMPKWIWIFFQESLQPRTPNGGYGTRGFGCPSARWGQGLADNGARKPVEVKVVEISLFTTGFSIHPKGDCLGISEPNYHKFQCTSMVTRIDSSIISIDFWLGWPIFLWCCRTSLDLHIWKMSDFRSKWHGSWHPSRMSWGMSYLILDPKSLGIVATERS